MKSNITNEANISRTRRAHLQEEGYVKWRIRNT